MNEEWLKEVAREIDKMLPEKQGFILFAVPWDGPDMRLRYVSNLQREDAVNLIKEWLVMASGEKEWMKHIE